MRFLLGRCIAALACTLTLAACVVAVPSSHTSPPPPPPPEPAPAEPASIDVDYFYDSLDPYGEWFWMEPEGWVWAPGAVDSYWRPYTVGQWAWTDYGWMWVSDEPWGWAAYHYGRWTIAPRHGWVWVPGDVWGPAWVAWRQGPGVVGWAPLPPQVGFSAHAGLDFGGVDINIAIHSSSWSFVDEVHIIEPVYRHLYPVGRNVTVIRRTTPRARIVQREGRVCNDGYPRERAEHAIRRPLPRYRVVDGDDRREGRDQVRGNEVHVWRPWVRESSGRPDPRRRGPNTQRDENLGHAREADQGPPRRQAPPKWPRAQEAPPTQAPPAQAPPQERERRMDREPARDSDQPQERGRRDVIQKPQDPPAREGGRPSEPAGEQERRENSPGAGSTSREHQQQPGHGRMEKNPEAENIPQKGQKAESSPGQRESEKPQGPAKHSTGKAGGKGKGAAKKGQKGSSEESDQQKPKEEKPQDEKPPENKP